MAGYSDGRVVPQGQLRIYLGAAAGVGKTYAMLSEGHRRAERGADVAVAFAEPHQRPRWLITEPGMGYRYQPKPSDE